FSPDGHHLATAEWDQKEQRGSISLWDVATPGKARPARTSILLDAPATCVAFSPGGDQLVTATGVKGASRPQVKVWEVSSGKLLKRLVAEGEPSAHREDVRYAVFTLDGQHLMTTSEDDT